MKLGYVILYVQDVERAVAFYERAFGLARRFVHESNQYAEMETGATALAFVTESLAGSHGFSFRASRPSEPAPAVEVAFTTPDVPAAFETAVAAGAQGVSAPVTKPWGQTVAYVRDLDGFLVELCTPMG
ncbi:VOC family protein [Polyangium mundeleinium]|uniref:VOC family protein n=1 Tax=Polyangium mundeleinium TaxID=2995306 RepID=A0ABT5EXC4_9BACT|nr:VOC family protein [Polyangium mundeleinium]MDC0746465.1 VOC family protein [Polyangium mundeleinium]